MGKYVGRGTRARAKQEAEGKPFLTLRRSQRKAALSSASKTKDMLGGSNKTFRLGKAEGYHYAEQERVAGHMRPAMPASLTKIMSLKRTKPGRRTNLEAIMAFDTSRPAPKKGDPVAPSKKEPGSRGLKKLGVARTHIVADSNVAKLIEASFKSAKIHEEFGGKRDELMMDKGEKFQPKGPFAEFLRTLGGKVAVNLYEQAVLAEKDGRKADAQFLLGKVEEAASLGRGNIGFGSAETNLKILHGFDPQFDDNGRMTEASQRAAEALRGLWVYPELQEHAQRAAQPTVKTKSLGADNEGQNLNSGQYVSSSLKGAKFDMNEVEMFKSKPPSAPRRNSLSKNFASPEE